MEGLLQPVLAAMIERWIGLRVAASIRKFPQIWRRGRLRGAVMAGVLLLAGWMARDRCGRSAPRTGTPRRRGPLGILWKPMVGTREDSEQILQLAAQAAGEVAPVALLGLQGQLRRVATELEATRRAVEAIRLEPPAARERLARLEAAQTALYGVRARLRALEAAGPIFDAMHARLRALSPSLESARRALEATPLPTLATTRHHVRALATEVEAASRTLQAPASVLESLRARARVLDALEPLIIDAREKVARLETLSESLEGARRELRAISAETEAALRALEAVLRVYEQ
jgi:hypothetical protein